MTTACEIHLDYIHGRVKGDEDYRPSADYAALAADAQRDYEGMREFQAKFIAADHRVRDLEAALQRVQKALTGTPAEVWISLKAAIDEVLATSETEVCKTCGNPVRSASSFCSNPCHKDAGFSEPAQSDRGGK